jgi:hypothetical protein
MKRLVEAVKSGPVLVGEVRGVKAEVIKRHDKSDKNAPPLQFGIVKVNLELLSDGAPVMLTMFLKTGTNPEQHAAALALKRGDYVLVKVGKLENEKGTRRATCSEDGITVLDKSESAELRG